MFSDQVTNGLLAILLGAFAAVVLLIPVAAW